MILTGSIMVVPSTILTRQGNQLARFPNYFKLSMIKRHDYGCSVCYLIFSFSFKTNGASFYEI